MRNTSRFRIKLAAVIVIALAAFVNPRTATADPPICEAGGPGADSCSLGSSCNVRCAAESSFACCSRDYGCYCVDPM